MLVNSSELFAVLLQAKDEIAALSVQSHLTDFYQEKLAAVWRRASKTKAYQNLPSFTQGAFAELPVTVKDELKARPWDFMATDINAAVKYYETTGTSGRVTPTPRQAEDVIWNVVSVAEAWRGVMSPRARVAILLPSDIVPVADLVAGVCEYLNVLHARMYPFATGISDWDRIVELLRTLRPTVLFLAPGVALQFTRLLKQRRNLEDLAESVESLMLLGEVSTGPLRSRLGAWWNATAYDASYGSTETGTLAATCGSGRLHLLTAGNYFELANAGGVRPLPATGTGRLVVTPLNLRARPLLRFDTGDEVDIDQGCECGAVAPTVVVKGRSSDAIRVSGVELSIHAVEEVVYGATSATGYLLELDPNGESVRLLLERDVEAPRAQEPQAQQELQRLAAARLGLTWDDIRFVNTLPASTKSGGSQKSWKRSNVRVVELVS